MNAQPEDPNTVAPHGERVAPSASASANRSRTAGLIDILAALARFGLAAVWLASGWLKLSDLMAAQQAIAAYELLPHSMIYPLALALPTVELILGLLMLVGLFLRPTAILSALIFAIFIAGIASAWARGLSIDCGCFGGGGEDPNAGPAQYMLEIGRDLLFIAMAAIVAWRPFRRFALHP